MIALPLGTTVCFPNDYPVRGYMERRGYVVKGSIGGACFARRELYSIGPAVLPPEPLPSPFPFRILESPSPFPG
jgi:hypothetical protein